MTKPTPGQKVLVECYSSYTGECTWVPAEVTGTHSALDRDYRVNVRFASGIELNGAAPECVKPYELITPTLC